MDHMLQVYKILNIQNHMKFLISINTKFPKCLFFKNLKSSMCVMNHLNSTIIHAINWSLLHLANFRLTDSPRS